MPASLPAKKHPELAAACLFNLREQDLGPGSIQKGAITAGTAGFSIAEKDVPNFSVQTVDYQPNRCVRWYGSFLTCMTLPGLPMGSALRGKASLRHKHYVVAEFVAAADIARAKREGLPLVQSSDGRTLANLELFSVPERTPAYRRSKLL